MAHFILGLSVDNMIVPFLVWVIGKILTLVAFWLFVGLKPDFGVEPRLSGVKTETICAGYWLSVSFFLKSEAGDVELWPRAATADSVQFDMTQLTSIQIGQIRCQTLKVATSWSADRGCVCCGTQGSPKKKPMFLTATIRGS